MRTCNGSSSSWCPQSGVEQVLLDATGMVALIAGEIGGFAVIFAGFVAGQLG